MRGRKLMGVAWPAFIAASLLQAVVFALVDPLELHGWGGQELGWSRQAVYAAGFFLFWCAAMLSSILTLLLGVADPAPAKASDDSQG